MFCKNRITLIGFFGKDADPWEGAWHPSDPFFARDPEWMQYGADAFNTEPLVSCWHENEIESVAMWKLYVSGREGVAIKTTVSSLIQLFSFGRELKIGRIGYWDVDDFNRSPEVFVFEDGRCTGNTDLLHGEAKIFRKNRGYAHENEVRALIYEQYCGRQAIFNNGQLENIQGLAIGRKLSLRPGLKVKINLSVLIQRIVVSPSFPAWAIKPLQKAVDAAFSPAPSVKVESSVLLERPVVGGNRDRETGKKNATPAESSGRH